MTETSAITPSLRYTITRTYIDLAETNRMLGFHDIADRCDRNASALLYGGTIDLEPAESEVP
jgi:hypothetical protein